MCRCTPIAVVVASALLILPVSGLRHTLQPARRNDTGELGLNDAMVARGKLYFGTATHNHGFRANTTYNRQLNNTHDFGQITAAVSHKWNQIEPERDVFTFERGDEIASLAEGNGQLLRCHALLWHIQLPGWVTDGKFDNATLISVIQNHITHEVSHYKGKCYAWDVVNEGERPNADSQQLVCFFVFCSYQCRALSE